MQYSDEVIRDLRGPAPQTPRGGRSSGSPARGLVRVDLALAEDASRARFVDTILLLPKIPPARDLIGIDFLISKYFSRPKLIVSGAKYLHV